jgi:hypothetical protein
VTEEWAAWEEWTSKKPDNLIRWVPMGTHLISFSKRFKNYLEDIKNSKYSQNIFALFILLVSLIFIFAPFRSQEL